jgi:uncharacterized membrane protein SpoIIM required for sporulation/uncharacterized RDD family membrane protein YckC
VAIAGDRPHLGVGVDALERRVEIETPEQVTFSYSVAGVGSRAAALLIDYAICFVPGLLLFAAIMATFASIRRAGDSTSWFWAFFILAQFAVFWGYHVLFEGLRDGQTPGKKRLGLRVVLDGGYGITLSAAAVRNIARLIDMQPALFHLVAIVSATLTRRGKRLGDILAGTMVVQEKMVQLAPDALPAVAATSHAGESVLTDTEFAMLDQWVVRRQTLDPERRRALADTLHARFASRLAAGGGSPMSELIRLHEREKGARTAGSAARNASGAARERHRLIAQGQPRWSSFERMLGRAQRSGLRTFSENELADFVARYRELAADLARLRTASEGQESSSSFALGRLVAAGHNVLYRRRPPSLLAAAQFVAWEIPREVRRSALPVLMAATLLFLPMTIAYIAVVRRPAVAMELLPAGMIDRAERATLRAKQDAGYVDISEAMRPLAASAIIANNVQVSFGAFAFGLTAGIGTVLLLVTNGVSIGSVLGLYASKGVLTLILSFIAPHGVLELSAIAIAGGAGLLVASAILIPGTMSRSEALVARGRRAIRLIAATVILLLVAGAIEGLYSPSPWPFEAKLFVSAVTAVALAIWLTRGRHARIGW